MSRFSDSANALVGSLCSRGMRSRIQRARASFRPAEIAGRQTSWRKDDTRLHVDSFPASPVQGRRILRVFSNVNPAARPQLVARGRRASATSPRVSPAPCRCRCPAAPRCSSYCASPSTRRTPYDALMLQLHDRMKEDDAFQRTSAQDAVDFPAGSTWIAFTDRWDTPPWPGSISSSRRFCCRSTRCTTPIVRRSDPRTAQGAAPYLRIGLLLRAQQQDGHASRGGGPCPRSRRAGRRPESGARAWTWRSGPRRVRGSCESARWQGRPSRARSRRAGRLPRALLQSFEVGAIGPHFLRLAQLQIVEIARRPPVGHVDEQQ